MKATGLSIADELNVLKVENHHLRKTGKICGEQITQLRRELIEARGKVGGEEGELRRVQAEVQRLNQIISGLRSKKDAPPGLEDASLGARVICMFIGHKKTATRLGPVARRPYKVRLGSCGRCHTKLFGR